MCDKPSATMKSALFYGKHDIKVEEIPLPDPKGKEVRVKVAWW